AGAFTREQLGRMKQDGRAHAAEVRGRFEWMRRELLGVVGGSFYHETPILVQFRDEPMIWFNRDESGYLLLNVRMLTASKEPRLRVEDNYWITRGNPDDFECPPSGKRIRARYSTGDDITIEFLELNTVSDAQSRYPTPTFRIGNGTSRSPWRKFGSQSAEPRSGLGRLSRCCRARTSFRAPSASARGDWYSHERRGLTSA